MCLVSFVIVYRGSQILNFAHGEFLTLGSFLMISFVDAGMPWVLALLLAPTVTGLFAILVERSILRKLVGRPVFIAIILTLFIGLVMRIGIHLIWGVDPRGMPTPWDQTATTEILGANILYNTIGAVIAGVLCLLLFFGIQRYTRLGTAMRATSMDQEAALALGVLVGRVFAITWFIAAAFAAVGGIFLGMFPSNVDSNVGYVALRAFPAIIVGGLESPLGALLASLVLGLAEVLTQTYVNPALGSFGQDFHVVFPYIIMIVFMIFKPYGIFGRKEVERA